MTRPIVFWGILTAVLAASRFAHVNVLWADEDYHIAAAIQLLHGKALYSELWYDKPPGAALAALLFGAYPGWPLRLMGTLAALAGSALAYRFASRVWGPREGYIAAALLAFCQVFYFAPAALPLEPDTWMILPHLAAVYWAWRGRAFASGLASGIAFLLTPKGAFVLAAALVFQPGGWLAMLAGFAIPNAVALGWLAASGSLADYWTQVWRWGLAYASAPPQEPAIAPLQRLANWIGFHAILVLGSAGLWVRRDPGSRRKWAAWLAISLVAVVIGWRMPPRYFNQLLPPLVIAAAGGLPVLLASRIAMVGVMIAIAIPVGRFGPRYFELAGEDLAGQAHAWTDVRLDQESRIAASLIERVEQDGDTIFIWGYRPNIVAYTRLPVESRLWESQPLTGVPADRHLLESQPIDPEGARKRREELARTHPEILIDGLSAYNPQLDIRSYPELSEWFEGYCQTGQAGGIAVYRRCLR